MKREIITCDIEDTPHTEIINTYTLTVVKETDDEEGRSISPRWQNETLQICQRHVQKLIEGRKMISAVGAMGYNKYYIR